MAVAVGPRAWGRPGWGLLAGGVARDVAAAAGACRREARRRRPRAPPVPVPAEDFNFEEGNQKFKKEVQGRLPLCCHQHDPLGAWHANSSFFI